MSSPQWGPANGKQKHTRNWVCFSGEGGIRTRDRILARHSLSRRAHSATLAPPHVNMRLSTDDFYFNSKSRIVNQYHQRREWDSNPRWLAPNMFSRHAPSAARPSLQRVRFYHNRTAARAKGGVNPRVPDGPAWPPSQRGCPPASNPARRRTSSSPDWPDRTHPMRAGPPPKSTGSKGFAIAG